MSGPAPPPDVSIAEETRRIRSGESSALELTDDYLSRIEAYDEPLNVYRTVMADRARARAAEIDEQVRAGTDPGLLAGVPVALKDNIEVAGVPMTASTGFLRDNVAESDAPVTVALERAGAVILGKLHMSEWAIGGTTQNIHFGVGHNPWDPARVPGGSSGGSGAAIAADLALATLGTDTGGSIRLPGSLCGAVGLRPTKGRVSNRGSVPVAWSFDTIGPLARRAEDAAAVLTAIAGYDRQDPVCEDAPVDDYVGALERGVDGLRIGVLGGSFRADPLTEATSTMLDAAAAQLEQLGVVIDEVLLPGHPAAVELTADLLLAEAAAFHQQRLAQNPDGFAPDVLARLRRGQGVTGAQYAAGRQAQRQWRREVREALADHDLLLAPGCPFPAPLISDSDPLAMTGLLAHFISVWVLAGLPAMVLPAGFVDGLPVAMQLIGRPFEEATLLRAGHAYQQVTDWHLRRPRIEVEVKGVSDAPLKCQAELERLLAATGASRTTLRIQAEDGFYPVVGEARDPRVGSLIGSPIDIRSAATFRALDRDRGLLVQDDLSQADPPPPRELIEVYGARAQMLAPLERAGRVVGVISVHEAKGPRPWTEADRAALIAAADTIAAELRMQSGARASDADGDG